LYATLTLESDEAFGKSVTGGLWQH